MLERMLSRGSTPPSLMGVLLVQLLWKSVWWFLRKLGINLSQDPTTSLFSIYPKYVQSCYKDICSDMFIAALFVIARTWKQPRCFSTEEWIKKNVVHLHNGRLLSSKKKNDILKFALNG